MTIERKANENSVNINKNNTDKGIQRNRVKWLRAK